MAKQFRVAEMDALNRSIGQNWFNAKWDNFLKTKCVSPYTFGNGYFITQSKEWGDEMKYQLRQFNPDYTVSTIYTGLDSEEEAKEKGMALSAKK